jgi:hypothetical protein
VSWFGLSNGKDEMWNFVILALVTPFWLTFGIMAYTNENVLYAVIGGMIVQIAFLLVLPLERYG